MAEKTREAMLVCEAAGYDVVIVETVGVGQSEIAVAGMTDMFVLMQLPNAGDDLQAIKKGVMELADLVVINKADLDPDAATRAQAQVTSALRLFTQHGKPPPAGHHVPEGEDTDGSYWQAAVMRLSALTGEGVDRFWSARSVNTGCCRPGTAFWPSAGATRRFPGCGSGSRRRCGRILPVEPGGAGDAARRHPGRRRRGPVAGIDGCAAPAERCAGSQERRIPGSRLSTRDDARTHGMTRQGQADARHS